MDGDDEQINVSDDEDLLTAFDVANKELNGNLKFVVEFKPVKKVIQEETKSFQALDSDKIKEKIEKKLKKATKKGGCKKKKAAEKLAQEVDPLTTQRADTLGQPQVINEQVHSSSSDAEASEEEKERVESKSRGCSK